ncbi:MAG: PKD domain-containing protein [Bacteroidota bacterium]
MKTKITTLTMLLLTIMFSNCSKTQDATPAKIPPVADYTFTGANAFTPTLVTFTNTSTNATSYVWDFGDGSTTSTLANPTHTFTISGTFSVKLTATGDGGTSSTTKTINISNKPPTADFTISGLGRAPCIYTFTNQSTDANSYVWDFGDGSATSILTSPTHTYTVGGIYQVKLTATGAGGSVTKQYGINISNAYTSVKINSISVSNLPFINPATSTGWNSSGGPNVYFKIEDVNSNVLLDASANRINGVTQAMLPISWNFSTPYVVSDLSKAVYFNFFNHNTILADNDMSYAGFLMTNYSTITSYYPTTATVTQNGWTVTLSLTWQ